MNFLSCDVREKVLVHLAGATYLPSAKSLRTQLPSHCHRVIPGLQPSCALKMIAHPCHIERGQKLLTSSFRSSSLEVASMPTARHCIPAGSARTSVPSLTKTLDKNRSTELASQPSLHSRGENQGRRQTRRRKFPSRLASWHFLSSPICQQG